MVQASGAASAAEVAGTLTPPGTGTFTTIHFVFIALLALAALAVILFGVRRARARREAQHRVDVDAAEAGVPPPPPAPTAAALQDAPIPPRSLDRSTVGLAPAPVTHDDLADPRPVALDPVVDRRAQPSARPIADPAPPERPLPSGGDPVVDDAPPTRPIEDERIAAAAPMDASPAIQADPAPAPTPADAVAADTGVPSPADGSVTQLKGVGPKVAVRLAELGVTTVGQIAALDADQAQMLDGRLGPFTGRLHRDRWIEQARFLAAGDRAGYEAVFGKL